MTDKFSESHQSSSGNFKIFRPVFICALFLFLAAPFYSVFASSLSVFGDINDDCIVNSLDWSLMGAKWLTSDAASDLNNDGIVNSLDWSNMSLNWLKTCTDTPPPSAELVPPIPSDLFAVGDRVRVSPDTADIYSDPVSANLTIGTQAVTSMGSVTAGPSYLQSTPFWRIDFDSGLDGWADEYSLIKFGVLAPGSGSIVPVIVGFTMSPAWQDESGLTTEGISAQRARISALQDRLIADLGSRNYVLASRMETVPGMALELDSPALSFLQTLDYVSAIGNDNQVQDFYSTGTSAVSAQKPSVLGAATGSGAGLAIVIIDTGVDATHPVFAAGQVLKNAGACFSSKGLCSGGTTKAVGGNAGDPCLIPSLCYHGTSVAGAALKTAPGVNIISIRVGGVSTSTAVCGSGKTQCKFISESDELRALEYVLTTLRFQYPIAAVNISLGSVNARGDSIVYRNACDREFPQQKRVIDQLRSFGIATVSATGNDGRTEAISGLACISSAISVGAVSAQGNSLASFSNSNRHVSLVAPGEKITVPDYAGGIQGWRDDNGTSLASPQVAGAFAVLKQSSPGTSVKSKLATLQITSVPIKDKRNSDPLKQFVQCKVNLGKAESKVNEAFTLLDIPGASETNLNDINKCGQIAAGAEVPDPNGINFDSFEGYIISNGEFIFIPTPGGATTPGSSIWPDHIFVNGINNLGTITGEEPDINKNYIRTGYIKSDTSKETFEFGGAYGTSPSDINNLNYVSGFKAADSGGAYGVSCCAFLKTASGVYTLSTGQNADLNDYNQLAGTFCDPICDNTYKKSGYIWHFGIRSPIKYSGAVQTFIAGINNTLDDPIRPPTLFNTGEMVGSYRTSIFGPHTGFKYSKGIFKAVTYPGSGSTVLTAINDSGYAVGTYADSLGYIHGFMVNLNLLP